MILDRPIFLVGYPRSGTTFLQSLLATQNGVISFPETHYYTVLTGYLGDKKFFDEKDLKEISERAKRMLELDLSISLPAELSGGVGRKELLLHIIEQLILKKPIERRSVRGRILEKTPSHAWHMEKILVDHPDAYFVHIIRHPLDSILSHRVKLSQGTRSLDHLIADWERTHNAVSTFTDSSPKRIYTLKYEDLVKDRTREMRKLMEFLDMSFTEEDLNSFGEKADELIMPFETWKSENKGEKKTDTQTDLSLKEKALIQFRLSKAMNVLGYEKRNTGFQMIYDLKNRIWR